MSRLRPFVSEAAAAEMTGLPAEVMKVNSAGGTFPNLTALPFPEGRPVYHKRSVQAWIFDQSAEPGELKRGLNENWLGYSRRIGHLLPTEETNP